MTTKTNPTPPEWGAEGPLLPASKTTHFVENRTKADTDRQTKDLTPLQERALAALLTTISVEEAAKKTRVTSRTLRRWLGEPAFRRAYLMVRRQALEQATATIQQAVNRAVSTLDRSLCCGNPSVEVRAAQVMLEQAARGVEMLEFEERLHALEASHLPVGKRPV